jgi:hypothetical protein
MMTTEAMRRSDGNYSAWADQKAWMDIAFARALRAGTDAVHGADPTAYAGNEGGQIPGWGGYDYSHLANAVDLMELYDYGDNVGIVRSLNPRIVVETSSPPIRTWATGSGRWSAAAGADPMDATNRLWPRTATPPGRQSTWPNPTPAHGRAGRALINSIPRRVSQHPLFAGQLPHTVDADQGWAALEPTNAEASTK